MFSLYGQMVIFLHRLQRVSLPSEDDWDSLKSFDCLDEELLTNEQFMVQSSFKDRLLTVVKSQIDVESGKK